MKTGRSSLDAALGLTRAGDALALGCRIKPFYFVELHYTVTIQLAD